MQNKQGKDTKKKINTRKTAITLFLAVIIVLNFLYLADRGFYENAFKYFNLVKDNASEAELSVHFINVGQGDCSLIINKNISVLIDTGDAVYSKNITDYIKAQGIEKLNFIIITHPHYDHAGGLEYIINNINVDTIIMNTDISDSYEDIDINKILSIINKRDIKYKNVFSGEKINLDTAILSLYYNNTEGANSNESSIVIKLEHNCNSFLITGDIEKKGEQLLMNNYDLDCDVLKVSHHGSSTSSSEEFLKEVSPEYCVISCGSDNNFNHPSEKTVAELKKYTDEILRTDLLGNIIFESDGQTLKYFFEKSDRFADN